jgi:predicted ester cyclase
MPVLSVMSIQGDPDELVARMRETVEPVAARKAPLYGGISSTIVRTDDGITIYNLWEHEEGRHQMADDPEVRAAISAAGFPEPRFTGYEVLAHRTTGEAADELARRVVDEIWTQGRLEAIDELFADDYRGWNPTTGQVEGRAGMRQTVEMYLDAFSNVSMTADDIVCEGDRVVTFWTARGTHTGELMGVAPTGREVTVSGMELARVSGGKIVEGKGVFDALGMLQQMGAVPAGAPATAPS